MPYKGFEKERVLSWPVLEQAHKKLDPIDKIIIHELAQDVEDMVLAITPQAKIGRGFSMEILAAIGQELERHE